jgi:GAF domain-containing protein
VFDEEPLARLLEAAYVLQEHNRELKDLEVNLERQRHQIDVQGRAVTETSSGAKAATKQTTPRPGDYTHTLAQIVEVQHQIQARHLDLDTTIMFIADRIVEIAEAGGCAIGILQEKTLLYRAAAGAMAPPAGSEVPMAKALCVASLRTGQVIRCPDISTEFLLDVEECRSRGIQSMIAVPVYHEDNVVGGLELYYASANAFIEQDVHTCQLMAGLITEALVRTKESALKKSVADERALMLQALEKLKPNLAALVNAPTEPTAVPAKSTETTAVPSSIVLCRKCGNALMQEEQFCGKCGTPRSGDYGQSTMQSKVAYLWQMQEAQKNGSLTAKENEADPASKFAKQLRPEKPLADSIEEEMPELFVAPELRAHEAEEWPEEAASSELEVGKADGDANFAENKSDETEEVDAPESGSADTALVKAGPWTSAANARAFLEQLRDAKSPGGLQRFWNSRRGDIYLAIALLLVLAVLRWGIWSSRPVSATSRPNAAAHHKVDPTADLSWFDRTLVSLGLAEPPAATDEKGNPETQVWVDLQTALYYCPGTDLYGKTPKGKYTSQRDAQLDQFEPAYRKPCN